VICVNDTTKRKQTDPLGLLGMNSHQDVEADTKEMEAQHRTISASHTQSIGFCLGVNLVDTFRILKEEQPCTFF